MNIGDVFLRGSLKALTGAWSAVGGAVGLVLFAVTEGWLSVPIGIALSWYVAIYIAHHNAETELQAVKDEAARVRATQPLIVFDRSEHAPVRLGGPNGEQVEVWQLWFRNRPSVQALTATAQQMTAEVTFCDEQWQQVLAPFVGQWAVTQMPQHVGWIELLSATDLPAIHTWAKLMLIAGTDWTTDHWEEGADGEQRMVSEKAVYALAGENIHHEPHSAAHWPYKLDKAAVRVRVTLAALNMPEQVFHFRLERQRDGSVSGITPVAPQ